MSVTNETSSKVQALKLVGALQCLEDERDEGQDIVRVGVELRDVEFGDKSSIVGSLTSLFVQVGDSGYSVDEGEVGENESGEELVGQQGEDEVRGEGDFHN